MWILTSSRLIWNAVMILNKQCCDLLVCSSFYNLAACGQSGHRKLQSRYGGPDGQHPSQLHVCGAVSPRKATTMPSCQSVSQSVFSSRADMSKLRRPYSSVVRMAEMKNRGRSFSGEPPFCPHLMSVIHRPPIRT